MDWRTAHRTAMIRAAQAHRDLAVDTGGYVDPYQALARAGVTLMAQPMSGLFAVYLPATSVNRAGVLVNSDRDDVAQRHSVTHEIGHHLFDHALCLDEGADPFDVGRTRTWPAAEKQAEAFAPWFLMPRRAVTAAMNVVGVREIGRPDEVYQLALHLGTSYQGTLRHLANLNMINNARIAKWAKTSTATLRRRAQVGMGNPPPGRVWALGPAADGAVLRVRPGDRLCAAVGSAARDAPGDQCDLPRGVFHVDSPQETLFPADPGQAQRLLVEVTADFIAGSRAFFGSPATSASAASTWQVTLVRAPKLARGLHSP